MLEETIFSMHNININAQKAILFFVLLNKLFFFSKRFTCSHFYDRKKSTPYTIPQKLLVLIFFVQ